MRRERGCGRRGVAIVEFALVLPLFLVLVFAITDFGLFFFTQHTIQSATREAVRLAAVGRTLDDGQGNQLGREASIVKAIHDRVDVAVNPSAVQVSVFPVGPDYSDPADWQTTLNAGGPGTYMRVRTRYAYRFLTPFLGRLFPKGHCLIRAQATYRNEMF